MSLAKSVRESDMSTIKLLREFSTPIAITSWPKHPECNEKITKDILSLIENRELSEQKNGQYLSNILRELGGAIASSALVSKQFDTAIKTETNDNLHILLPSVRELMLWIIDMARIMIEQHLETGLPDQFCFVVRNSWASIYKKGDYHPVHSHPMATLAAVYCVDSTDELPPAGLIDLYDPRPNIGYYYSGIPLFGQSIRSIKLNSGDLLIFPAWLNHFVHPLRSSEPRITISANIDIERIMY